MSMSSSSLSSPYRSLPYRRLWYSFLDDRIHNADCDGEVPRENLFEASRTYDNHSRRFLICRKKNYNRGKLYNLELKDRTKLVMIHLLNGRILEEVVSIVTAIRNGESDQ